MSKAAFLLEQKDDVYLAVSPSYFLTLMTSLPCYECPLKEHIAASLEEDQSKKNCYPVWSDVLV